jgi:hypothetical protein
VNVSEEFRNPYPDYDVLDKWDTPSWDEQTREVVHKRLNEVPERAFLDEKEWTALQAICERLIPQPDRPDDPVPIAPFIDQKLQRNQGNGYRYEDMPPMRQAWRQGLAGMDSESLERHSVLFAELDPRQQDELLSRLQRGEVTTGAWQGLPPAKFFEQTLLKTVVGIYYSHPSAWSEIGYGGPASPRGYVRLGLDQRDPWEAKRRHERDR